MRSGWLKIPGIQDGARTLDEQLLGLEVALLECAGKSVLDLGAAEGLIAIEFAKRGASRVLGVDSNVEFIRVAREELRKANPLPVQFEIADVMELATDYLPPVKYDIVLALAILHKLEDPAAGVRFCAESASDLIVIRLPRGSSGLIEGKFTQVPADVPVILVRHGFVIARKEQGPRGEWVHYYRRVD